MTPICRLLALSAATLAVGATTAAAAGGKVIGHVTGSKGRLTATATAGATAPRRLSVRVLATPAQPVVVRASVLCSKSGSTGKLTAPEHEMNTASKSSTFRERAPLTRALALPVAHPTSWCSIVVYSTLSHRGSQSVDILAG